MMVLRVVRGVLSLLAAGALAALLLALSGREGEVSLLTVGLGDRGTVDVGLRTTAATAVLLLLVTGVGAVVASYSVRNLTGQHRVARYAVALLAVVLALVVAVSAASLPLLAIAWAVPSLALPVLVSHAGTAESREAARLVRARLLIGDALLAAAVVLLGVTTRTWDLAALPGAVASGGAVVAIAALLVVAAGTVRSALVPAHRWLPETAEAPSPVSALLHAGLVNGLGVLALLLWPLVQATWTARAALLLLGATTALVATAQLRTRADVKGRLAASTSSQMGYLAVQVGLGLPAAALAHIVGHGVWKATLFLRAGGAVDRSRRPAVPAGRPLSARALAGAGAASAAVVAAAAAGPLGPWPALGAPAELLPLVLVLGVLWLALAHLATRATAPGARLLASAAVLLGGAAYLVGLRGLTHLLAPAFGEPAGWADPAGPVLGGAVAGLVAVGAAAWWLDTAVRRGALPTGLPRRVARASLRPWPVRERLAPRPVAALAVPPVADGDAERARQAVAVAGEAVAPVYPLTSFVASNPLAGVEALGFPRATALAEQLWGAQAGPSGAVLRDALGSTGAQDLDRAVTALLGEGTRPRAVAGRSIDPGPLLRALVLDDEVPDADVAQAAGMLADAGLALVRQARTPMEAAGLADGPLDRRVRALGHHCCARALAGAPWPGEPGPWRELRGAAPALDDLLRVRGAASVVSGLPEDPAAAVAALLEHLGLEPRERAALLSRLLLRDPGWPGHLSWRARHARLGREAGLETGPGPSDAAATGDPLLTELVATRLALEVVVAEACAPRALGRRLVATDLVDLRPAPSTSRLVAAAARTLGLDLGALSATDLRELAALVAPLAEGGLAAVRADLLDGAYRRDLHRSLRPDVGAAGAAAAQVVTCIDVRSERLRRHLESVGPWETFGTAGFFGLPLRHVGADGTVTERAPALLRPSATVRERAAAPHGADGWTAALASAVRAVEAAPGLPFAWAEAVGWIQAPVLAVVAWRPRLLGRLARRGDAAPAGGGRLDVVADVGVDALADAVAGFLATTALTHPAPLLVVAGHGGAVANNPHVAAYDCGACGGAAGDVSARAVAAAINDSRVRDVLRARGIVVPEGTRAVAALHDTTRDVVHLLDVNEARLSPEQRETLARLRSDLAAAATATRAERAGELTDAPPAPSGATLTAHVAARAVDWAQPRPEWGLAGAAAIVVGPRSLTAGADLDGRVFLQSYRAEDDPDGSVLETLLAAPVVVAQWITAQYWASTVDPLRFGAGDKTTHNVVGDGTAVSAVVTGARGDLRIGLPWQAVMADAPRADRGVAAARHVPQRLLATVCAPVDRIEAALSRRPAVAALVTGGWITLCAVDPGGRSVRRRTPHGAWVPDGEVTGPVDDGEDGHADAAPAMAREAGRR